MNEIQIFNNPQFGEVRVAMTEQNEPLFCASDVAKALGYLRPADAVASHCKGVVVLPTPTNGGMQQVKFIKESDVYRLVMKSKAPNAEKFQDWVCEEVLPSIRKTGGYIHAAYDDTPETIMARAVLIAQDTIERQHKRINELEDTNTKQSQIILAQSQEITEKDKAIAELNEKTSYMTQILSSKSTVTITQIAADYGMSAKAFNVLLRNMKIQRKVGGQWILYAVYQKEGYTSSETFIPENSKTGRVVMNTKWTQKGRLFLYATLKSRKILPMIERD